MFDDPNIVQSEEKSCFMMENKNQFQIYIKIPWYEKTMT